MRCVLQRVTEARVEIAGKVVGAIGPGLVILLGIEEADDLDDIKWLVSKIGKMRIFGDDEGRMNRNIVEATGRALVVSQFTLHASTRKGNRPSFIRAARPEQSRPLYEKFCAALERELDSPVATGRFGADMKLGLVNDGPVTILIDSKNRD